MNTCNIVSAIDTYLEQSGKNNVTIDEAREMLWKKGLLDISFAGSAKLFEELLKAGSLPYARRDDEGAWVIPHSQRL
jgi:hypothetical protein